MLQHIIPLIKESLLYICKNISPLIWLNLKLIGFVLVIGLPLIAIATNTFPTLLVELYTGSSWTTLSSIISLFTKTQWIVAPLMLAGGLSILLAIQTIAVQIVLSIVHQRPLQSNLWGFMWSTHVRQYFMRFILFSLPFLVLIVLYQIVMENSAFATYKEIHKTLPSILYFASTALLFTSFAVIPTRPLGQHLHLAKRYFGITLILGVILYGGIDVTKFLFNWSSTYINGTLIPDLIKDEYIFAASLIGVLEIPLAIIAVPLFVALTLVPIAAFAFLYKKVQSKKR